MLLDFLSLFEESAAVAVTSRPSGDEMYAIRLVAMQDEEAALALYASEEIDFETMMAVVRRLN